MSFKCCNTQKLIWVYLFTYVFSFYHLINLQTTRFIRFPMSATCNVLAFTDDHFDFLFCLFDNLGCRRCLRLVVIGIKHARDLETCTRDFNSAHLGMYWMTNELRKRIRITWTRWREYDNIKMNKKVETAVQHTNICMQLNNLSTQGRTLTWHQQTYKHQTNIFTNIYWTSIIHTRTCTTVPSKPF